MPAIPLTMRAAAIDRFGGPEVLRTREMPVPEIDADEVLIAVHTAGVGSWDADIRSGWWPGKRPRFPLVLGTDGSGTVVAAGGRVRRLKVGDKVNAYSWMNSKGGFYAEYVAVAAEKAAPITVRMDMKRAGAIPVTGLTALQGIDNALRLRKGQYLAITGASGGVGTVALQFAKLRGARLLAVASGKDGIALVRRLGADVAVDGHHGDLVAAIRDFAPGSLDAVLALVGGKVLERCMVSLGSSGRVAYPNGVEPEPKKRRGIEVIAYDAVPGVKEFQRLTRAVEAAQLKVVIAAQYPLEEAARSHTRLAEGHVLGKVVLRIR